MLEKNLKILSLTSIVFILPFADFIKNNINEIDIIIGKSFYFLILVVAFFLFICAYVLNFFLKKSTFYETFLIIVLIFWLFFKHQFFNHLIKDMFKFHLIGTEYSSEISLLLLVILSIYISILIYKKNIFLKKFLYFFFFLSFFVTIFQIILLNQKPKIAIGEKISTINFPDKLNIEKQNIYFFILDAMQPIKGFEKYYKLDLQDFLDNVENKNYKYFNDTTNLYDNTSHGLSAIFYLNEIFTEDNKLKEETKVLYPTLLRINNRSDLINNLDNLGYEFKWLGNFFAYCPKFNLKYCLYKNQKPIVDTYLYINFFRKTPLIQTIINFGYIFNFDFNKHFFFKLNDGMGRLVNYLKENNEINKPRFYFIHHMSPHWPYITNADCSYKSFPGNRNYDGYKSAYLCNIKKIQETINFLDKFDPNSTVIFQSDHNWEMSLNQQEKKMIFNLIKVNSNCKIEKNINLHNVNVLRLVLSCMTGNSPKYTNN